MNREDRRRQERRRGSRRNVDVPICGRCGEVSADLFVPLASYVAEYVSISLCEECVVRAVVVLHAIDVGHSLDVVREIGGLYPAGAAAS